MQRFWCVYDKRRERFVSICRDRDVQQLTWQAYMPKKLVRAKLTHMQIFLNALAYLMDGQVLHTTIRSRSGG
jgi:geranylgeranyl diphosphate/geranylgeranyl-bacteriochlorophyllide a reductase